MAVFRKARLSPFQGIGVNVADSGDMTNKDENDVAHSPGWDWTR